ncbi:MAG: carbohydrate kinase family protein [Methanolinea sp.]|nr:carbohydrate kinase family protein [Methanolinea sp.]
MIYVVGHTAIDHICRIRDFPPPNGSVTIEERKVFFGGGAANIAAGIVRLGVPCTLVSAVGDDFAGSGYDSWQKSLGIRQQLFRVEGAHTPTAFMFTNERGDQITFFEWGASGIFATAPAPALPFVHMATADPDFNVRVAQNARFCTFDPGQDLHRYSAGQLESILSRVAILFANQHEVEGMCRTLGLTKEALSARVPIAVFTAGAKGSDLFMGTDHVHIPAVRVKMADPTGAGDAYRAGFLAAYHRGYAVPDCCWIGSVTASFAVEVAGCQTNLPTWEMMVARYSAHFGAFPEPSSRDDFEEGRDRE